MIVNGSADWGVSDPLSLIRVVEHMREDGHDAQTIDRIVFSNATAFYGNSGNWKPELGLEPVDPREFQR
jgi:predicted metal-dependent TIM-barrel fold hydrolase